MHLTSVFTATALGLAALANAQKGGKSRAPPSFTKPANIYGCVWQSVKPNKHYTVNWSPGGTGDRCMRLTGSQASMTVSDQGLTCISLGKVAVDCSGLCFFRESWWGLSYLATGAPYSGSLSSRWTTGPANSDITLHDQSAGTNVCSEKAHCTRTFIEWDNNYHANLYFVFEPGKVQKFMSEEDGEIEDGDEVDTPVMRQEL